MSPSISVITLGVADLARSRRFYCQGLGFLDSSHSSEQIAFLHAGGLMLALYPRHLLAEDAQLPAAGSGFGGITLARNLATKEDVDVALLRAEKAGAKILKSARDVFWGGYSGYFADLDGHPWEVAYNPHWELDDDGRLILPD